MNSLGHCESKKTYSTIKVKFPEMKPNALIFASGSTTNRITLRLLGIRSDFDSSCDSTFTECEKIFDQKWLLPVFRCPDGSFKNEDYLYIK